MMKPGGKTPYILCIMLQSVVYGLGNPLTKIAFESISALWCLAIRFSLAALILFAFFGRRVLGQLKSAKVGAWLPGSLCMAAAYMSCNIALSLTTATNVGFLMSLPVVFTPALSALILKRKYRLRSIPVQAAVVAGLYFLCCGDGSFSFGLGEVMALVCSLAVAFGLVFTERALSDFDPIAMSTVQAAVTAVICVAAAFLFDSVSVLRGIQAEAWLVIVYLAVTCTCLAYVLQNVALTKLSSAAVSMLQCVQPILTAFFSFIILGERLSAAGFVGAFIITACVVFENYVNYRREKNAVQIQSA